MAPPPRKKKHFNFFNLPIELRLKILECAYSWPHVIDLDRSNYAHVAPLLRTFLVSRAFYKEAYATFFGINRFQIFPTHSQALRRRTRPIVSVLTPHYRASLKSLEFLLGPNWNQPPPSWVVNEALGLEDMVNMRVLKVHAQIDPSLDIFKGFRIGKNFYTDFAARLLGDVLEMLPNVREVWISGEESVKRNGKFIDRLIDIALVAKVRVFWRQGMTKELVENNEETALRRLEDLQIE